MWFWAISLLRFGLMKPRERASLEKHYWCQIRSNPSRIDTIARNKKNKRGIQAGSIGGAVCLPVMAPQRNFDLGSSARVKSPRPITSSTKIFSNPPDQVRYRYYT